jgi:ATPase subunit of ABC transporter with duplicated ATPase domains
MTETTIRPDENMRRAWDFVERTGVSIFLTGKAGTGKTTFLKEVLKNSAKTAVVVAPTGVAAINAGGVTIHSFFQISPAPYIPDAGHVQLLEAKAARYPLDGLIGYRRNFNGQGRPAGCG